MKLVDIAEFYSEHGGGVRTYIRQKMAASARLGHSTVIIAPGAADAEISMPGGKVIWVKAPRLPFDRRYHLFASSGAVFRILEREQPDVIEGSSPWRGGWLAANWPGQAVRSLFMHADPVASYPHTLLGRMLTHRQIDGLFSWFWKYLQRLNLRFDVTVVSGNWLASRFQSFGLQKVQSVPFGVDRSQFHRDMRCMQARRDMLQACGLDDTATVLIAVGRHHPEKHIGTLIDAVTEANRTRKVGLYLVGDGLIRPWVDRKARAAPHVHVAGQINDRDRLATLIASADALIHGCASETYGLAVAEALCSGTPVIVPDAGGAHELADPACGQIYRTGNALSAADAIGALIARSRDTLSRAAIHAANARIGDITEHFEKLFNYYQCLIEEKSGAGKLAASSRSL